MSFFKIFIRASKILPKKKPVENSGFVFSEKLSL